MPAGLVHDRYELTRVLGHGGGAVVWQAHDVRLDRPVALKRLTPSALDDPAALDRFHREARTIANLAHPNIVTVHDVGRDEETPFLVLELVDGPSLAEVLREGPLPVDRAVEIARQTCRALTAAHAAGVVHRDIKPANLLLTSDGLVKVCDFGIAHLQNTPTLSPGPDAGLAVGTSHYMAPETISGGSASTRTDLYAVGCLLYALLVGHPPFLGDSPVGVAVQHLHDEAVAVASLRPDCPPDLAALVHELLAKDPDRRPASAADVERRLAALRPDSTGTEPDAQAPTAWLSTDALLDPAPAAAVRSRTPPPRRGRHSRPDDDTAGRRRLLLVVGGAAVAVTLAIGYAVWAISTDSADPTGTPAAVAPPAPGSTPTPGPTTTVGPTPTTRAPSPAPTTRPAIQPPDTIAGIRALLPRLVRDGSLDPDGASELEKKLAQAAEAAAAGNDGKARNRLRQTAATVVSLHEQDRLTSPAYELLGAAVVNAIEAVQPE